MKVVTFNIQHGRRAGRRGVSNRDLARYCAGLEADVLALQEVDMRAVRSGLADQAAVVAGVAGMAHVFGQARRLGARPAPRLLLGDLNLGPEAVAGPVAEGGLELLDASEPTYPAPEPTLRIDHIAVDGLAASEVEVLPPAPVSDHRALSADLAPLRPSGHRNGVETATFR